MPTQIVRVVNTGSKPLRLNFNTDMYEMTPGKSAIVPFDVAAYWFGDPRVHDQRPGDRTRIDFYNKKRAFYSYAIGFDVETEEERAAHPLGDSISSWEAKCPQFEVWSTDESPERVWMLLEDPDGSLANPALGRGSLVTADQGLRDRVESLETLLAEALNLLRAQDERSKVDTAVPEPSPDTSDVESLIPDPSAPSVGVTDQPVPEPPVNSKAKVDAPRTIPTGRGFVGDPK